LRPVDDLETAMSIAGLENAASRPGAIRAAVEAAPAWLWLGAGVFVMLVVGGDRMLLDADTYWQIAVGQSILDQRAWPVADIYSFTKHGAPWISSSWLAQVLYALALSAFGWAGPVMLAALGAAAAFALLVRALGRRFAAVHAVLVGMAAALVSLPHLLTRPHVLALPVMVAWVIGLADAADARRAPSFWLLGLLVLWANLHGGFVLGLALVAPFALDAVWSAPAQVRAPLALRWAGFGIAALAACCITPYGWDSLLAARQILGLGGALALIPEWQPANFANPGLFELGLLAALALALWRGVTLPVPRILLLLGFLHMALSHNRNTEVFALLVPLVLAAPLATQLQMAPAAPVVPRARRAGSAAVVALAAFSALVFVAVYCFSPVATQTPVAAVDLLQERKATRILHNPGFGGYLITRGIPVFIDGRAELYGEDFVVGTLNALDLKTIDRFVALLDRYAIDATLLRPKMPAIGLLDRLEGWQRVYADDIAVVHVRTDRAR
jgi:hypothetical protein